MNKKELLKSFAPPESASASEKWIHEQGYGMTAGELWVLLEEIGAQGFAADECRRQFLAAGTIDFDLAAKNAHSAADAVLRGRREHPGTCAEL